MGYEIKFCAGMMPNQAEGTVNGYPFYFRARHGMWELNVGCELGTVLEDEGRCIASGGTQDQKNEYAPDGWWESSNVYYWLKGLLTAHADWRP